MTCSKTLIFLHIPRTAGSMLKSILSRVYAPQKRCSIGLPADKKVPWMS